MVAVLLLVSPTLLRDLVVYLVPMILSLSVHEFAHAFVATRLGDDTPTADERVTLSPLAHIDPLGTLIVPALSIVLSGAAFIGWARPVGVNPARFHRGVSMRFGMALVAVAGPLSNLLLALLAAGALSRFPLHADPSPRLDALHALLAATFSINVGLCIFNLLPIPPLDGSRVLPRSMDELVEQMTTYSTYLIAAVVMVPFLRRPLIEWPIQKLYHLISSVFGLA